MVSGEQNKGVATRYLAMQRGQWLGARKLARGAGMEKWQRLQLRYGTGEPFVIGGWGWSARPAIRWRVLPVVNFRRPGRAPRGAAGPGFAAAGRTQASPSAR